MESRDQITEVIYQAIDELNRSRARGAALVKSPDTVLIGDGATLDSIGFVGFAVTVEQMLEHTLGQAVSLIEVIDFEGLERMTVSDLAGRLAGSLSVVAHD